MNREKISRIFLLGLVIPSQIALVIWGGLSLRDHWEMTRDNGAYEYDVVMTSDYELSFDERVTTFSIIYKYGRYDFQDVRVLTNLAEPIFEGFDVDAVKNQNGRKPMKVYVNKKIPKRYSLFSPSTSINHEDHLVIGAGVLSIALIGLYFCLRREPRVQDLIPK